MFVVCEGCGEFAERTAVVAGSVRCACGHRAAIRLRPLFLIVGPSGVGKSSLALRLPTALPEAIVLDGDVLWGFVDPDRFRSVWVRLAANLAQGDRPVVILSSFTGDDLQDHPRRECLGRIHTLGLVCDEVELAARLRARPAWRGVTESIIETMATWNAQLRSQASFPTIDTGALSVEQTVQAIRGWVISHLAEDRGVARQQRDFADVGASVAEVVVTIPADVQQIDETGYVWTILDEARAPDRVWPGALIIAGDPVEPFLARVVDLVERGDMTIVHLEVLGVPEDMVDELRHANLLPR